MTIDNKSPSRRPGSLLPELFDQIEYAYPDDVTVVEVYSYAGSADNDRYVTGIIYKEYEDKTQTRLKKQWRHDLG